MTLVDSERTLVLNAALHHIQAALSLTEDNRLSLAVQGRALIKRLDAALSAQPAPLDERELLRLMRKHLPARVHQALTHTVWKDGIDIDYPTIDLKTFAQAVAKFTDGEKEASR